MSQKQLKPTLTGQRIRTRKRDEKEKYEPLTFRDSIIAGLNASGDLEKASKYLDGAASSLDYHRYAEVLFDVLIAGGMLAPGGGIVLECSEGQPHKTTMCLFDAEDSLEAVKEHVQLLNSLMRRYKYLQKNFEDEMNKVLQFLKGFTDEQRHKLALYTGLVISGGIAPASALCKLLSEHLVKPGLALTFMTNVLKTWLGEKDMTSVGGALKKAGLNSKLLEFLPGRQSFEAFEKHFTENKLPVVIGFQKSQQAALVRRELQSHIKEMLENEIPVEEMVADAKGQMQILALAEPDVIVLIWKVIMSSVEWNKKEEFVAEQALKHLKVYAPLFAAFSTQSRSELTLIVRIQEYCYENMNFMKVFQKIIMLLYKTDVLSEDCILKWYKDDHSPKGKSVFLAQMKKMVEWLQSAEEESSSGDEQ
ncbi:eIF5-mimic protein 1-like [Corticium candelabrum]|uniref:eIF5-mimic protein 1-like n=1 Tax=Corticium candelabrum TaxID=121492 RepID=UPI002E26545E|nr:eIF5-mimic protein 1-like [Corticium candelabrum]